MYKEESWFAKILQANYIGNYIKQKKGERLANEFFVLSRCKLFNKIYMLWYSCTASYSA